VRYTEYKASLEKPHSLKVEESKDIIAERLWEFIPDVYVAFSGGKDSTVVLYLALQEYPDIPVMFNNTGVEHPATIKYVQQLVKEWDVNLIETKPIKSFWQCVKEYGYPAYRGRSKRGTGGSPRCCIYTKERPAHNVIKERGYRAVLTGITGAESMQRRLLIIKYGHCYSTDKNMPWQMRKIHPIWNWTPDDVWQFIEENGLPYNPIYDEGLERCGCMPCTGHIGWREKLIKHNPAMAKKITDDMGEPLLDNYLEAKS